MRNSSIKGNRNRRMKVKGAVVLSKEERAVLKIIQGAYAARRLISDKPTENALSILGIKEVIVHSNEDWVQMVRSGFRAKAMRNLMAHTSITIDELAGYTHTDKKILQGYDGRKKLDPVLSERTAEIANVYGKGEVVFGDAAKFKNWMDQPLVPLGNKKPKEFLDTSFGIQMLMDELGRIEHGIYA